MPSITLSIGLRPPKALLTATVVATKPTQTNRAEMTPFFRVTCPGPRWPSVPASTQAITTSATNEVMNGAIERLPEISSLVLPIAASHCLDSDM